MKRSLLSKILMLGLFSIIGVLGFKIYTSLHQKKEISSKLKNLPGLSLVNTDSVKFDLGFNNGLVLIIFNSTCGSCQSEAHDIKTNIHRFSKVDLLMISSENISSIRAFAEETGLQGHENIQFAKITSESLYETFGQVGTPHIFIYSADRMLVKEIKGEVKIETLLSYL